MPIPRLVAQPPTEELVAGFERIRQELHVPGAFPPAADAEADAAGRVDARVDRTDLALVTIDPEGSRDLDQAYTAARRGDGYRVFYAIADVGAFVHPGDALDAESHERGVTLYSPDRRSPLYPDPLGEGAASLLPDQDRPALLWQIDLDGTGNPVGTTVARSTVRSRAALSYPHVQATLDAGGADEAFVLLREIGERRQALEEARGGVNLNLPDQQIAAADGGYRLEYRASLPVEEWNAQLSLLTGMEAARMMLAGGVGILRTLPPVPFGVVNAMRRSARSLGCTWPRRLDYAAFMRQVDRTTPVGAALVHQAARAYRGAGYAAFTAGAPAGPPPVHSAVGAPYAHVTAPLRRLADRFANEVVLALAAGVKPPDWVLGALGELPKVMGRANQREHSLNSALVDYMEAMVLRSHVGDTFAATVTDVDDRGAMIQLSDPAVLARMPGEGRTLGESLSVRLVSADPAARKVVFEAAPGSVADHG
jgi:exoribonuclease R